MALQGAATPGVYQMAKSSKIAHPAAQRGLHLAVIKRVQAHRVGGRFFGFLQQFFFRDLF